MLLSGLHAFRIVDSLFYWITEDDFEISKKILNVFDNNVVNFCILVFTGKDSIGPKYSSIEECLNTILSILSLKRLRNNYMMDVI